MGIDGLCTIASLARKDVALGRARAAGTELEEYFRLAAEKLETLYEGLSALAEQGVTAGPAPGRRRKVN